MWEDVSTLLFTHIGEYLPVKKTKGIGNMRTICEQIGIKVGRENK